MENSFRNFCHFSANFYYGLYVHLSMDLIQRTASFAGCVARSTMRRKILKFEDMFLFHLDEI